MRILHVSSAMAIGGGEIHLLDLCQALLERGHHVHLVVRPNSPLPDRLGSAPITVHELPLRNAIDLPSARALSRVIQQQRIDIIHGHVARDYPLCLLAEKWAGRGRVVLTRHHYLPVRVNRLNRALFRRVGRVIAVSESVRRGLLASLPVPAEQIVTIPNWVNCDAYRQAPPSDQARRRLGLSAPLVVGMVGQMTPTKGQEEFLRAAARVSASREDVAFLVVGREQKGRRFTRRCHQLVQRLDIAHRVTFVDHIEDLSWVWSALTVLVVPSWQEAFSIVLIQAMAAGLPVIASRVGGPAEIITHGVTGWLVPPREIQPLAEAIERLLDEAPLRERLGRAARAEVRQRFDRSRIIERIESVYREVMMER